MIEIGKTKLVQVIKRVDGKFIRTKEAKTAQDEVWRICRNPLGGSFGSEKRRRLVVGLVAIDQLVIYPSKARHEIRLNIADIYAWALRSRAQAKQLETARQRKLKLKAARIRRQITNTDRRLRNAARKDRGA